MSQATFICVKKKRVTVVVNKLSNSYKQDVWMKLLDININLLYAILL